MKLNPRNGIVRGSLLGLAVYGCVGVAGAADFYVSPTGNDSNDGLSPATAKRTLTGATGAIFAANSSAGADTINCAAGDYSAVPEPGTVAITEAVSILGPVGVRDLDPRSYIPSLASPNRTPAGAAEARFQTAATLATGVFNIAANNVTIKGLSIETTAVTQPIIHSAGARQNVVIEYNIIWRASVSAPNATPLVGIFMSDSVNAAIRSNSFQNIAGADTAAPDAGVIWLTTPIDPTISSNEIRNTGAVDRSCGILLENSATGSDVVIDRNRVWANTGEGIGKYGISVGPGNTGNRIMISNNSVEDFEQAGISIQCPRVDVIGNYVGNINASTTGALARAGIYVRDTSCTDIVLRDNQIGPSTLSTSTSNAGLRYQAYVATVGGPVSMIGTRNNMTGNNCTATVQNVGFGVDGANVATPGCVNNFDVRNNWWGTQAGPSRIASVTATIRFATQDVCTSTLLQVGGIGDAIGVSTTAANRPFRFEPWALFRGIRNVLTSTGPSVTTIAGIGGTATGNDRYSKHSVSLPGTTALTTVGIWSPDQRVTASAVQSVNNAALFVLDPPTALTGNGTVTVEYTDTGVTAAANDTILSPFFPTAAPETAMRLAKWNGSAWEFIPSTVNTTANTVTATISAIAAAGDVYGAMPSPLPEVTNTPGATTLNKPGPAVTVDAGVIVTDANSPTLDRVTVTITNLLDGANEVLAAAPSGGIVAGDITYSSGVLTVDPAAPQSLADFQAVLASVTYNNTAGSPNLTPRILAFAAVDADTPAPGPFTSLPSSKTVNINVVANIPPTANNDTLNVNETVSTPGNLTASDPDGTIASYTIVTPPTLGSVSGFNATTGAFNYTSGNFTSNQVDSLQFIATDNVGADSTTATITINITATNDNPTATADTLNVTEGIGAPGTLQGTDADNAITGYAITTPPDSAKGTITGFNPSTGTYTYTALERRANTTDSFQFTVTDALGGLSAPATITVNITADDDAPTLNGGSTLAATVGQGGSVTITAAMLQIDDIDTPAEELTVNVGAGPSVGSLSPGLSFTMAAINANAVSYTHNGTGILTDSFNFTFTDGTTVSGSPATFNITVTSAVHDWTLND